MHQLIQQILFVFFTLIIFVGCNCYNPDSGVKKPTDTAQGTDNPARHQSNHLLPGLALESMFIKHL